MVDERQTSDTGNRLTRLEADQRSLVGVVEELRDAIVEDRKRSDQRFERLVESLDSRFRGVYGRLDQDRKVPWAPIGLALSIVLAAVSGWWTLSSRDLARVEKNQEVMAREAHEHDLQYEYQRGRADEHRRRTEAEQERSTDWMVKLGNQIYETRSDMGAIRERLSSLEGHQHADQR